MSYNIRSPFYAKGTATSLTERDSRQLRGLLPPALETMGKQVSRAFEQLRGKTTGLEKYIFLAWLRNTNSNLFYRMVLDSPEELMPLIYTPTVGTACANYSHIYPFLAPNGSFDGLFISIDDIPVLDQLIENYKNALPDPSITPDIAVITDGSRILGLGDLGVGGMGIPVGKLQLYVAAAGLDPRRTLPICLDFGTNNQKNLDDPLYLGLRRKRPEGDEFHKAVDSVLATLNKAFPKMLIQFEDFSSEHAFELLERHRNRYLSFNDDIQGTGAVILAGFINAVREVGIPAKQHRLLFFGAGSAGVGVAKQIMDYFVLEHGMTEEEAKKLFWLNDSKGLVTQDRGDKLAQHKVYFARDDNEGRQLKDLKETIEYVKPTALIGLSSQGGVFDAEVLKLLADINERPIVFPLSNPATQAECSFEQAMIHTNGNVLFASGTAFPRYVDENKKEHVPGQGNNMYIFPGLGLGAILSRPSRITDTIIYASAAALADSLTEDERKSHLLYPRIERIREVSAVVAAAVCRQAVKENLATDPRILSILPSGSSSKVGTPAWEELLKYVEKSMWEPTYKPITDKSE
ncbi:malic enzyme [Basidiobolus meristosporus CBS 931.73]|uniref:Malic enzyme n=1 Tax=Basidiobolus meristosporus CBS 931.73 TaxID=1314790 RepID=A0A1Y1Y928_9FUNG|nr:malic enzyme [Basidiobolus meristosporus CBS 931.73]|eukprot:ORX94064.1 malic enzyme [Basidiobolus meristosporus CBS 931.73]